MIHKECFDELIIRCPSLGGEVPFSYCRKQGKGDPCPRLPRCWMARVDIENIGRRPHIRRIVDIAIPLDTPLEKVDQAVAAIRKILENHDGMDPEFPPRVYFTAIGRDALTIRVIYWFHPAAYWDYLAFCESFSRAVLQQLESLGVELALPSTKTVLQRGNVR